MSRHPFHHGALGIALGALLSGGGFALATVVPLDASAATLSTEETLAKVEQASKAIDEWDLPAAAAIADELEKGAPDQIDSIEMRAVVRFHQGRYAEAVKLLDVADVKRPNKKRAGAPKDFDNDVPDLPGLIRNTAKEETGFVEKKGEHFTIRYRPGPDGALVDWALETLEAQRAALEKDFGYAPPENVPVEILPDTNGFTQVTTLSRKEIKTTGTIALCKFNKLMVTTPGALGFGYAWRDTLAHEYTHYVIARSTHNKVPIWLHEGSAKYEEVRWRRTSGGEPSPITETALAEAIARDHWITLQQMHPSIAKLPTAADATLAFAEVENMIGFCVRTWGYEGVRKLFGGLRDEEPMDAALLGAFNVGLRGLEEKWKEDLKAQAPKANPDISVLPTELKDPKADSDKSGAAHEGLSDSASDHLHLGDLLAGETRLDAAVVEYRKARDAERSAGSKSGHAPIFDYKIAQTLFLGNHYPEAKKVLASVIDTYPSYAPALKTYGQIELLDHGDPKKAKDYLERSLWLAPFDPEVYSLISQACERSNDKAGQEAWDKRYKNLLIAFGDRGAPVAHHDEHPKTKSTPKEER